jgi:hypothetical protein
MVICLMLVQQSFAQGVPWMLEGVVSVNNSKLIINCKPYVDNQLLSNGDYIGVFDSIGRCYGLQVWQDSGLNKIALNGSNGTDSGLLYGSKYSIKVWLRNEDCIVDKISQVLSTDSLIYRNDSLPEITNLYFEKYSINYPKQDFCINASNKITPVFNYKPTDWTFTASNFIAIDSATGIIDPLRSQPGIYNIQVNANNKCMVSNNLDVTLRDYPRPHLPDTVICNDSITIDSPAGYSNVVWSNGTNASSINVGGATNVSYTVTNEFGCSNSDTIRINKITLKRVDYSTINADCDKKGRLSVTNQELDYGLPPYTYSLKNIVDNSVVSDMENVPEGVYNVNVINSNGCELKYNANIVLEKDCLNDIPVFTPNADGLDDTFFISLEGKIKIFDRSGKLKRQLDGPAYFDGNDDGGTPLPMGTYLLVTGNGKTVTLTIVK